MCEFFKCKYSNNYNLFIIFIKMKPRNYTLQDNQNNDRDDQNGNDQNITERIRGRGRERGMNQGQDRDGGDNRRHQNFDGEFEGFSDRINSTCEEANYLVDLY